MGSVYYKGYYDSDVNTIYVNCVYGVSFSNLLHEMGHWLLCLLPRCSVTYRLNEYYDALNRHIQLLR